MRSGLFVGLFLLLVAVVVTFYADDLQRIQARVSVKRSNTSSSKQQQSSSFQQNCSFGCDEERLNPGSETQTLTNITTTNNKHENETSKGKQNEPFNVFYCGYKTFFGELHYSHLQGLFADADKITELSPKALKSHTENDIVVSTIAGPCTIHRTQRGTALPQQFHGKILYINGEPTGYPLDIRDGIYSIGCEKDSNNTIQVVFGALYLTALAEDRQRAIFDPEYRPKGTKQEFLIYAASNCVSFREAAFAALSQIGNVFQGGFCGGGGAAKNVAKAKGTRTRDWTSNIEHFRRFRFALVMENTALDGYITEKIFNAFLAGSIPIWYGTRQVFDIFHKDTFIFYDPEHPQVALDQVRYLEENPAAYAAMLDQPILANGNETIRRYFSLCDSIGGGELKRRIRRMMNLLL